MNTMKILVADDDKDILEITAKKLKTVGYEIITAIDGEEALVKIRDEAPDIIILDLTMPKKDGFEVLQDIRKNPNVKKWQPVIILSGRRELEDMQKGYDCEADHYITKPCSFEDIKKSIELMIRLIPQHKLPSEG